MRKRLLSLLLVSVALAACSSDADDAAMQDDGAMMERADDSMEVGMDVPADWPKDVVLMEKTTVMYAGSQGDGGSMGMMLSSAAAPRDIVTYYRESLQKAGWSIDNVMISSIASGIEATKDGRHLVLGVTGQEGESTITIGIEAQ